MFKNFKKSSKKNVDKSLQRRLRSLKNKIGLIGGGLELKLVSEGEGDFAAHINPHNWIISITANKDWAPDKETINYCNKNNIKEPLNEVLEHLVYHETYHWKECPYDLETHDKIIEQISKVLKENDKYTKELSFHTANAFEDLMINKPIYWAEGNKGAPIIDHYGLTKNEEPSSFFKAFLALNAYSLRNNDKRMICRKLRLNQKEVNAVKQTIKLIDLKRLPDKVNKETLPLLAGKFAEGMIELIDDEALKNPIGNNVFQEMLNSREGREEIVNKRHNKGAGVPDYMSSDEYLAILYDNVSTNLVVIAESKKKGWSMPLVPYQHKPFDPEVDDQSKINIRRGLTLNDNGKLTFQVPRFYLNINAPVKIVEQGGMPDFIFLLDTSGSMCGKPSSDIPWGQRSNYHKALIGFYGALNYLKLNGFSKHITHELITFSDHTRASGKKGFTDLNQLKEMALNPEFGNTYLDMKVLNEELMCEPSVVIMLSDGHIFNWDKIKEEFNSLIDNHYFTLIQLDYFQDSTNDIISWGKPVYHPESADDLDGLIIDLTKQKYKRGGS